MVIKERYEKNVFLSYSDDLNTTMEIEKFANNIEIFGWEIQPKINKQKSYQKKTLKEKLVLISNSDIFIIFLNVLNITSKNLKKEIKEASKIDKLILIPVIIEKIDEKYYKYWEDVDEFKIAKIFENITINKNDPNRFKFLFHIINTELKKLHTSIKETTIFANDIKFNLISFNKWIYLPNKFEIEPKHKYIMFESDNILKLRDMNSGETLCQITPDLHSKIFCWIDEFVLTFSNYNKFLIVYDKTGNIYQKVKLNENSPRVRQIAFNPTNRKTYFLYSPSKLYQSPSIQIYDENLLNLKIVLTR